MRTATILLLTFISIWSANSSYGQTCYSSSGCQDYSNFGINSSSAATLEYDNFVSAFHQSVVRDASGDLKIWGERTAANGTGNLLSPTIVNSINFPGLTGTPLKASIGSYYVNAFQNVLLTTDGLWAWGSAGGVIPAAVKSDSKFGKVSLGLPSGVSPSDVKMLFATYQTLAITTCSGGVWVLTGHTGAMRGDGTTGTPANWNTTWARVQKTDGTPLTNVVATRGAWGVLMALTSTGEIYTWGNRTWLGSGDQAAASRTQATLMQAPSTTNGPIKMIGATAAVNLPQATYYVLYENGKLLSTGDNVSRQKGDFTTTSNGNWVTPSYPSTANANVAGAPMDNILWISPNEHDPTYPSMNVITSDNNRVFAWGIQNGGNLGRSADGALNPGEPADLVAGGISIVETGGHTTMVLNKCQANFGYVGHKRAGSMGDGTSADGYQSNYSYGTNGLKVCGAEQPNLPEIKLANAPSVNSNGEYCRGTSVQLLPTPAGGTLAIKSGAAYATLADSILSFTGAGLVTVSYTVNSAGCPNPVEVVRTFNVVTCTPTVTISGKVWNDSDGDAKTETGENGIANNMWANLVGPDGAVIASVKINADGTYTFIVSKSLLTETGTYSVVLTNSSRQQGVQLQSADTPANGYGYTGTNRGADNTADATNRTGKASLGDLSTAADNSTVANVNFGISNDPLVLPVTFGAISAKIVNGKLVVNWSTMSETNNDHFDIEISKDGTSFTKIATVKSSAPNGTSTGTTDYKYEMDLTSSTAILGIGILTLGGLALCFRRKRKGLVVLAMIVGSTLTIAGCKKVSADQVNKGPLFLRIVQVDVDGTQSFSKVVKVTAE
ncbi:hypothetical protein LL912_09400 [Niabella sp. CC-SYL272]|uniref:hypothetical protein n=1 Tax=Niabella agricola TaxID=2891571 RepID=UPI001F1A4E0E|nr:hypothetical protein [Niabella agricola]MCF3108991.1 hypothetical protein [Niabella agricola]